MIGLNGILIQQDHFPDNTLHLSLPSHLEEVIIDWRYESDAELFTLMCIRKHYHNYPVVLVMHYMPHARMDRVQQNTDVFTLKYFCEAINDLHFDKVYVLDAHSNVTLALLDNVVLLSPKDYIEQAISHFVGENNLEDYALFFPDEGAMKRYSAMNLGLPYAFGIKKRDWQTGKILGLDIANKENIIGKKVLIVDDICSKGGTFYYSAVALKEAGAKNLGLYVSHCENTILQGKVFESGLIDTVYTTYSLPHLPELRNKLIYVEDLMEEEEIQIDKEEA